MNWIRIDVRLFRHPKLALCPFEATGLFILYIAHCGEFETDGRFPVAQAKRIAQSAGADPEMIKYLLDAQVIAQDGEYYQLQDKGEFWDDGGRTPADPVLRREWMRLRRKLAPLIYKRDGRQCSECGSDKDLTIDHIIPIALGGENDPENLQPMCRRCNSRKGARA